MNNQFTRATQTSRQPIGNHRDQLVMTLSDVYWWPTTQDVLVRPETLFLQFVIVQSVCSGLCNVQTGITSSEGIAYQMKVDVEFSSQMTETVSAEEMLNAFTCLMEGDPWSGPKIMMWNRIGLSYKLGPIIFQNIWQRQCRGNWVIAALYIYQVLTPHAIHFLHVVELHFTAWARARAKIDFIQHTNTNAMPWPALNLCLNLIEHCETRLKTT